MWCTLDQWNRPKPNGVGSFMPSEERESRAGGQTTSVASTGTASMSESGDPIGAPRNREKALSAGYLRLLGHTQQEAANAAGVNRRTLQRWECSSWWPGIQHEAEDRWLAGTVGKARSALLQALEQPDGPLALRILERVVPELAPPSQRVELSGALAKIDFGRLTDEQLSEIAGGRHPYEVLAPKRELLVGSGSNDKEIPMLPVGVDEPSED